MKNRKYTILACLTACSIAIPHSLFAAEINWDGGPSGTGTDYSTAANWDPDNLPVLNGTDNATIDGTAIYTPGGDFVLQGGSTLTIASGGSWEQVGGIAWIQMAGGNLVVDGGTFTQGTAGNIVRNASSSISVSAGTANLNGNLVYDTSAVGAFSLSGTGQVNVGNEFHPIDNFSMSGGTLSVANVIAFVHGPGKIDLSGGNINLDGSGAFSGFYAPSATAYLNFTSGSVGTLRFDNYTAAELTTDGFLTNGTIQFNDTVDASAFTVTESGGGVNVALTIPEPGTLALTSLALGMLIWIRRRA